MSGLVRFLVLAALVLPLLPGQIWLRCGGPDSRKTITRLVATGSNAFILTSPNHGFVDGEHVWVSFLNGSLEARGIAEVQNVSENNFRIGSSEMETARMPDDAPDIDTNRNPGLKGYVGRVCEYNLTDTYNMLLDGPSGRITSQVRDPDGMGDAKAPKANSSWGPYVGMQRRLASFVSRPDQVYAQDSVLQGATVLTAALDWFMDNSHTQSLEAAKHWINNVDKYLSSPTFTACNPNYKHCGRGSLVDWISFQSANVVYAYSLIRSELTPEERQLFAGKMLNGFEDTCENSLKPAKGVISIAAGSRTVQGHDTSFLTEYAPYSDGRPRWINIRTTTSSTASPAWLAVSSVESDTSLTLASVVSATAPYENVEHYYTEEWKPGFCGAVWYASNHSGSPNLVTRRTSSSLASEISASDTQVRLALPGNFPKVTPFHILLVQGNRLEAVKVTSLQGQTATIERGQFYTSPAAFTGAAKAYYMTHPLYGGYDFFGSNTFAPLDSPDHNLTFAKSYGYLTIGLGLAADDQRARKLLQEAWNYYYDYQYPLAKAYWTGITQGGYSYGPARWMDWTFRIAAMMRNSFEPAIDITDGNWLKQLMLYPIYLSLPYNPGYSIRFSDSGFDEVLIHRTVKHVLIGQDLLKGRREAAFANFWYRSVADYYADPRWYDGDSQNSVPYAVLYTSPDDSTADFRDSLPPYHFFTSTDFNAPWNPGAAYNAIVSRQNWQSNSTYLWVTAFSQPTDHLGSYPGPGTYKLLKNQYLIGENGTGSMGNGTTTSNYVQVGAATNLKPSTEGSGQYVTVDRQIGTDPYVYARINSLGAFRSTAKLTRNYRHLVHLKRDGADYVIVYDDVTTRDAVAKLSRVHYYADDNESPAFDSSNGLITFRRNRAMVSTRVLLPVNAGAITTQVRTPSARETVQAVEIDGGSAETGEFLLVHKAAEGTDDVMPEMQHLRSNDGNFQGVLIADAAPSLVLFPRDGDNQGLTSSEFELQSDAAVLIAGLAPGIYSVTSGDTQIVTDREVGKDGTLYFDGKQGTIRISRTAGVKEPPPPEGAAAAAAAVAGKTTLKRELPPGGSRSANESDEPQLALVTGSSFQEELSEAVVAGGGLQGQRWELVGGDLPAGLILSPAGVLSGTPTQAGTYPLRIRTLDGGAAGAFSKETTVRLQIVEPVPELAIVSADRLELYAREPYDLRLEARSQVALREWRTVEGRLPEGVRLEARGDLTGEPQETGSFEILVAATDIAGRTATKKITLDVARRRR
jgi:hypothetical protein